MAQRLDILDRKEDILRWIEEGQPKTYICKELQCKQSTLNKYLEIMGIEYKGVSGYRTPESREKYSNYIDALTYIQRDKSVKSNTLKQKLFRDGIKEYKCELCGLNTWLDGPIPLELHHKDGNHYNNNLDNLQILCPNCHALQPNNSGKAVKIKVKEKEKKTKPCPNCGKPIGIKSRLCTECVHKEQYVCDHPSREELKQMIRTVPFAQIGRKYGVSDKAIPKWCISYNLPSRKKDINGISDEDWEKI